MTTERQPRIFTVHAKGERNVEVGIVYEGLKNAPADMLHLLPEEAVAIATDLLIAARHANR